jgi:hypothetical protein
VRKAALARSQSHLAAVNDLLAAVVGLQARVRELMSADPANGHSLKDAVDVDGLALDLDAAPEGVAAGSGFFDASSLGASIASLALTESVAGNTDAVAGGYAADSDGSAAQEAGVAAADAEAIAGGAHVASALQEPLATAAEPAASAEAAVAVPLVAAAVAESSEAPAADVDALDAAFNGVSLAGRSEDEEEDHEELALAMAIELSKGDQRAEAMPAESAACAPDAAAPAAVPIVAVQHEGEDGVQEAADAPASPAPQRSSGIASPSQDDWTMVDDDPEAAGSPHAPAQ